MDRFDPTTDDVFAALSRSDLSSGPAIDRRRFLQGAAATGAAAAIPFGLASPAAASTGGIIQPLGSRDGVAVPSTTGTCSR